MRCVCVIFFFFFCNSLCLFYFHFIHNVCALIVLFWSCFFLRFFLFVNFLPWFLYPRAPQGTYYDYLLNVPPNENKWNEKRIFLLFVFIKTVIIYTKTKFMRELIINNIWNVTYVYEGLLGTRMWLNNLCWLWII